MKKITIVICVTTVMLTCIGLGGCKRSNQASSQESAVPPTVEESMDLDSGQKSGVDDTGESIKSKAAEPDPGQEKGQGIAAEGAPNGKDKKEEDKQDVTRKTGSKAVNPKEEQPPMGTTRDENGWPSAKPVDEIQDITVEEIVKALNDSNELALDGRKPAKYSVINEKTVEGLRMTCIGNDRDSAYMYCYAKPDSKNLCAVLMYVIASSDKKDIEMVSYAKTYVKKLFDDQIYYGNYGLDYEILMFIHFDPNVVTEEYWRESPEVIENDAYNLFYAIPRDSPYWKLGLTKK